MCKDSCVQATNLLKMERTRGKSDLPRLGVEDFPSRQEPSNYFYTVLATGFLRLLNYKIILNK